jgi:dTDP-4-amino-4,6-dideoxygalactose transaminase
VGQSRGAFEYTRAILDDGFHNTRTLGHSTKLEEVFAERFEHKYGILYANGTATLHGALLGAGVGVGDEVIVPAFTPFPTASAVLYANAVPVIVDVDPETWTMDPGAARVISDGHFRKKSYRI